MQRTSKPAPFNPILQLTSAIALRNYTLQTHVQCPLAIDICNRTLRCISSLRCLCNCALRLPIAVAPCTSQLAIAVYKALDSTLQLHFALPPCNCSIPRFINMLSLTWPRKRGEGTEAPRQERRATSLRMAQGCWTLSAGESPRSRSPHWPEQEIWARLKCGKDNWKCVMLFARSFKNEDVLKYINM